MVTNLLVACTNNLETAYLWIIETAKTTDVHTFSELCGQVSQNIALLAFSHGTKIIPVPIKCWKHLSTMVELRLNITVHSEKIFASLDVTGWLSTSQFTVGLLTYQIIM